MLMLITAPSTRCDLEKMDPDFVSRAADTRRLRIIDALNSLGEMKVCDIMEHLEITQSASSQHLNQMRRAGLLCIQRRGKEVWYFIADERAVGLINFLCNCYQKNGSTNIRAYL